MPISTSKFETGADYRDNQPAHLSLTCMLDDAPPLRAISSTFSRGTGSSNQNGWYGIQYVRYPDRTVRRQLDPWVRHAELHVITDRVSDALGYLGSVVYTDIPKYVFEVSAIVRVNGSSVQAELPY